MSKIFDSIAWFILLVAAGIGAAIGLIYTALIPVIYGG